MMKKFLIIALSVLLSTGIAFGQQTKFLPIPYGGPNWAAVEITGGTIDGTTIGGTTPAAGTFTTLTTTGAIELGHASDTTIARSGAGAITIEGVALPSAATSLVGNCTVGPCFDGTSDGGTALTFYDAQGNTTLTGGDTAGAVALVLPIAAGTILTDASTASALTSLGTIASLVATTADINAGTFDGIVGGTTPAAGNFTTLDTTDNITATSATASKPLVNIINTTSDANASIMKWTKNDGAPQASGDDLVTFQVEGFGTALTTADFMKVEAAAAWGDSATDAPTKITFYTVPDNSETATLAMTIGPDQVITLTGAINGPSIEMGAGNFTTLAATNATIGAINGTTLLMTGRIDGIVGVTETSAATTILSDGNNASYYVSAAVGAANGVYLLPQTSATGKQYCFMNKYAVSTIIRVGGGANHNIVLDGVLGAAANDVVTAGELGDAFCVVGGAANVWYAGAINGTLAVGN